MTKILPLLFVAFAVQASAWADDDFSIESYQFDWRIAKAGQATLVIQKDEASTKVVIRKGVAALGLTPSEATDIGNELAKTAVMFDKFKDTKGQSEQANTGKHVVLFKTTDQGTFIVSVHRNEPEAPPLILDRDEAVKFAPHMKKAKEMAAFLDKKFKP